MSSIVSITSGNSGEGGDLHVILLLQQIRDELQRQGKLIEASHQAQKQSSNPDGWKKENPELAKRCGVAFKKANRMMNKLIEELVTHIEDTDDDIDSNYLAFEFVDKYGQRVQQLSYLVQVLSQIST